MSDKKCIALLIVCLMYVGCASEAGKPVPADNFDDLSNLDPKSDAFSSRMRDLGEVTNEVRGPLEYDSATEYCAVRFSGFEGDRVTAEVRALSDGADGYAWILDSGFKVLAKGDDSEGSLNPSIQLELGETGEYWLVFKELYGASATFEVEVGGLSRALPMATDFEQFMALSNIGKMRTLFPGYEEPVTTYYELSTDFTAENLRITTGLTGQVRERALTAYRELREIGYGAGVRRAPDVEQIMRDGQRWAIRMTTGGDSWVVVAVYDAEMNEIGGWSSSD